MDHFIKRFSPALFGRGGKLALIQGVTEGDTNADLPAWWKT
jgi:hypothetical protein